MDDRQNGRYYSSNDIELVSQKIHKKICTCGFPCVTSSVDNSPLATDLQNEEVTLIDVQKGW